VEQAEQAARAEVDAAIARARSLDPNGEQHECTKAVEAHQIAHRASMNAI
jgi:hypothetical protein